MIAPSEIKRLRSILGLTQKDLAEKIGTSIKTVANYEGGGVIPAAKQKLLKALLECAVSNTVDNNEGSRYTGDVSNSTIIGGVVSGSGNTISNQEAGNIAALKKEIEHLKGIIIEKDKLITTQERMINLLLKDQ